jgi:chromate reductase
LADRKDVKILGLAGSARTDSFNKKLLRIALRGAEKAGADVVHVDLRDYPLPLYDGDGEAEAGRPENAGKLAGLLRESDGLICASPEYNGFMSPLLKNTFDWMSRSEAAQPDLSAFQNKIAVLMSASPGPLGGLRGLGGVRALFTNLGMTVLPGQLTIRAAFKAFDDAGELLDAAQSDRVEALAGELASIASRLKRPL